MTDRETLSILQVCSAREAIYGAVQSLMTLARAQREAQQRVEFLTFAGKRFGEQVRAEQFAVHEIRVRAKIDLVAVMQMRSLIRRGQFDIVHTHLSTSSVNGCLAARLAGVQSVATVHGMSGRLSFAAANHLIAVSQGVRNHLVAQGVPKSKIAVVYNGLEVPDPLTSRAEARARLGFDQDAVIVGTVSRITPLKGIEDAVRAVAAVAERTENLIYIVVGDGDGLVDCSALARELGIGDRVKFVGYQEDIWTQLAAMDLFLFPTHKEAMGIALVEAMSAGLPAVTTGVGGIPEVANDDTAILVPAGRPEELANALGVLLLDQGRRAKMGAAARERARALFTSSAMESATDAVYRGLLGLDLRASEASAGNVVPTRVG